jgi:FlaA1/EpsC-like NDP-sugar epimerase
MDISSENVKKILGRDEYKELLTIEKDLDFTNKKILITGAYGSVGTALIKRLDMFKNIRYMPTDIVGDALINYMDITDIKQVKRFMDDYEPDFVINIAGAKHAPEGEHETWKTLSVNTLGTKNIIDCIKPKTKLILTSTCKSCNPEIAYGASKLIAERLVLNQGGSVVRFFNVAESSGNVFEIWDAVPENEPIKLAPMCERHFISMGEAVGLLFFTMAREEQGRFIVNSGYLRKMGDIANDLFPNREKFIIEPRRGDRLAERFMSTSESIKQYHLNNSIIELRSVHDK